MTPESVLRRAPLVLDQRAREQYFEDGFLTVPGYVGAAWLGRLRAVVAAKIDESRAPTASDDQFDLAPDHSADKPNIRRLRKAVDQHPELWTFAQDSTVVDLIADVLGPDLRFHSSKLNFKWSAGGDAVRWHQDIQAWPHTNFGVLTFGVYLEDTASAQGPLTAIPGSHDGPIFDQFDDRRPVDRGPHGARYRHPARGQGRRAVRTGGHRRAPSLPRGPWLRGEPLAADAAAAAQRVLGRRRPADHAGAGADIEDRRAGARTGATARAHGAVPGATATALGSGGVPVDLRSADDGVYGVIRYGPSSWVVVGLLIVRADRSR